MHNEDAIVTFEKEGKLVSERWVIIDTPGYIS